MSLRYRRATVTLPPPILSRIDRLARAHYRSRSDVVRNALIDYLARHGGGGARPLGAEAAAATIAGLPVALPQADEVAALARARAAGVGARTTLAAVKRRFRHVARRSAKKRRA
jgi:Arc/MetJ-type ribon-helix-helix transcriptional regulator